MISPLSGSKVVLGNDGFGWRACSGCLFDVFDSRVLGSRLKISIITTSFNAAGTIRDCLESVRGQTCRDVEHIVVDGGFHGWDFGNS